MYKQIEARLKKQGLLIRGGFHVSPADGVPLLETGEQAGCLLLIGNAGSAMWRVFCHSPEYLDGRPDSLDRWSARLANKLAEEYAGRAIFPFGGPPYHPFLSWAKRGEASSSSPLGLSLHPEYGLWHAYRFALALPQSLDDSVGDCSVTASEVSSESPSSPCKTCKDRPCLTACPVDAFTGNEYHSGRCAGFLKQNPDYACNYLGCGSRRACPVGQAFSYQPAHAQFHMRVFVAAHCDDE